MKIWIKTTCFAFLIMLAFSANMFVEYLFLAPVYADGMPGDENTATVQHTENIYYLSPQGSYTQIRLVPREEIGSGLYSTCDNPWEIYWNKNSSSLLICERESPTSRHWKPFGSPWMRKQIERTFTPKDLPNSTPYPKTFLSLYPAFDTASPESSQVAIGVAPSIDPYPAFKLTSFRRGVFLSNPSADSVHIIGAGSIFSAPFANSLDPSIDLLESGAGRKFIWFPERGSFAAGRIGPSGSSDKTLFNNDHILNFSIRFGRNSEDSRVDSYETPFYTPNNSSYSFILGGADNRGRAIVGGQNNNNNDCHTNYVFGGEGNSGGCCYSFIVGGKSNHGIAQDGPFVLGGEGNSSAAASTALGGSSNTVNASLSLIANGNQNTVGTDISSVYSAILNGTNNTIEGSYDLIATGSDNSIDPNAINSSNYSAIVNGNNSHITGAYHLILNGEDGLNTPINSIEGNQIIVSAPTADSSPQPSAILGGEDNVIWDTNGTTTSNVIISGTTNFILNSTLTNYSLIGNGKGYSYIFNSSYAWIPSTTSTPDYVSHIATSNQSFMIGENTPLNGVNNIFYTPRLWINTTEPISPFSGSYSVATDDQRLVVKDLPNGNNATIINSAGEIYFFSFNGTSWSANGDLVWNADAVNNFYGDLYSDRRLKKDIQPIADALATLKKLRGVRFEWKEIDKRHHKAGRHTGFIAQELEESFPQWVYEGRDGFLSISARHQPAALITAAIQELDTGLNTRMENQLETLETMQYQLKMILAKQSSQIAALNETIENNKQMIRNLAADKKEVFP